MSSKLGYGVHTYSVGQVLTYKQYRKIKKKCLDSGKIKENSNIIAGMESYFYYGHVEQGIKLYLFGLSGHIYHLSVQIEPCRVLGSSDPTALFHANQQHYKQLVKTVDAQLQKFSVPGSIDGMKVSRCDVTINASFDDRNILLEYLRILKKGYVPKKFEVIKFQKDEGKARDWESANKTSYCISGKNERFLVYDKISQLEMIGRWDEGVTNKIILRFEAELQREALKKYLGKVAMQSNWKLLSVAMDNATSIIRRYLQKMRLDCNAYLCYANAASLIENAQVSAKTKERMLYLMKKTSDSKNLNAALDKLRDRFEINRQQADRVLKKFRELGFSPVTLRNDSPYQELPSLLYLCKD